MPATPVRQAGSSRARKASPKAAGARQNPLGQTTLWTKEPTRGARDSGFGAALKAGLFGIGAVLVAIGRFFGFLARAISRSKLAVAAVAALVIIGGAAAIDLGMNWGKIYPGVHVGSLDLGGKTADEAQALIEGEYAVRLEGKEVLVFANEDASKNIESVLEQNQNNALAEQQSVEEAKANKVLWTADQESLAASFDTAALVEQALAYGREDGGIPARIQALAFGYDIKPAVDFDEDALESLAAEVDAAIGDPRVNFDIAVADGIAQVTEGHDGDMVERRKFAAEISDAFLTEDNARPYFVAEAEYAPLQITREEAQRTCDLVNAALSPGAEFSFEGTTWAASATDIGNWVKTRIVETDGGFSLEPYLDQDIAKGIVINHLNSSFEGDSIQVRFEVKDGERIVHTETDETIPVAGDAVSQLESVLFGSKEGPSGSAPLVEVASKRVPDTMTFDEALENGIISSIASFTTEYTIQPVSRQHNIHLGADLLNNSIIEAGGGRWSFNDISGDYNEEAGFQGAGAILDGEFVDAIGGGICQVATTVFNAVYESGFPVVTRHNHSLYIASYPVGRDAAVAYPDLNLVWENDSASDVLLDMSYTDTTVTATLYGVNPEYQVSTQVGEWQEGEKYKTKTTVDENLAPGTSYVKTVGSDGRKISIVRTVKDKNGTILHEDLFSSTYDPLNEVKVEGPPVKESESESRNENGAQTGE